jgi:chromosome segregation ATPase
MDEFSNLLRIYNDNYSAYRVSGNIANKTAYESALSMINKKLESSQRRLADDGAYIQTFLDRYSDVNPRIDELQKKSQNIQKIGPALQNEFEVSKRLNAAPQVQPINESYLYVKGAIVIGLLVIVGIVGAL